MTLRAALLASLLFAVPALAQEADTNDCGACSELDRVTTADPVAPLDLPPPPPPKAIDRGNRVDVPIPGTEGITIYQKRGGVWVSDLSPGGVFVKPKKDRLSVEMKF